LLCIGHVTAQLSRKFFFGAYTHFTCLYLEFAAPIPTFPRKRGKESVLTAASNTYAEYLFRILHEF